MARKKGKNETGITLPAVEKEYDEDETFDFVRENEEVDYEGSVMLF
jgi:hypothetical protein